MGIRYYAYGFDADMTDRVLADPRGFIGGDPLADAWGFDPLATVTRPTFVQRVPDRDLLYLDKAWSDLQVLTGSLGPRCPARPCHRMFEGAVTFLDDGYSWSPYVRALTPAEVACIAPDLAELTAEVTEDRRWFDRPPEVDQDYLRQYLRRAAAFALGLARDGRGLVYLIG